MGKVLVFPVKRTLSADVEKRMHEIAKIYVGLINEVLQDTCGDITDMDEYNEITNLMLNAFLEGVVDAVVETNEDES